MKIFKRKRKQAEKPTKQEIQELKSYYKGLTASISDRKAMDMLDSPERWHYLMLLKIADYAHMGKSRAILTAFKLGYLRGKTTHKPDVHNLEFQNVVSEAALKLEKASTVLRTTASGTPQHGKLTSQ